MPFISVITGVWGLFSSTYRSRFLRLMILVFVGTFVEMLGVGLIFPLLSTLSDMKEELPNSAAYEGKETILSYIKSSVFNNEWSASEVVIAVLVFFLVMYFLKSCVLSLLAWKQSRFVYDVRSDISYRLYEKYLSQPYIFHLKRNSAELIRNSITEVQEFTVKVLKPVMLLITEIFVFLGLTGLLLYLEPQGALVVVGMMAIFSVVFYIGTKKIIGHWGVLRQDQESMRLQQLQQGLSGIKDVKLKGGEIEFLRQYDIPNGLSAKVNGYYGAVKELPRLWLEFFAIGAFILLIMVMILGGKPVSDIVPTVGVFSAAAFRLLPSVVRLLGTFQNFRFGLPIIKMLKKELEVGISSADSSQQLVEGLAVKEKISLNNISFTYPDTELPALKNISIEINKGESIGLIGSSGAGKSTLVDILLGLLTPCSGNVDLDGSSVYDFVKSWQNLIGYVPQSIYLCDDTIRRNIAFGVSESDIDDDLVVNAARKAKLDLFIDGLPEGYNAMVGECGVRLSGGQRQRIGIARALYSDPDILVLDEATSALDVDTEKGVMDAIEALHGSKTILIIAHRLSTVSDCDRIFHIENGVIVKSGPPSEVIAPTQ